MLNLHQEGEENLSSYLGNVQNVENSSTCPAEMKDRHEEEGNLENQSDFITCPAAAHTKEQHLQSTKVQRQNHCPSAQPHKTLTAEKNLWLWFLHK